MKVLGIIRYEHTVTEFPRYSKTMGQENFGREVAIMGIHRRISYLAYRSLEDVNYRSNVNAVLKLIL